MWATEQRERDIYLCIEEGKKVEVCNVEERERTRETEMEGREGGMEVDGETVNHC